MKIIKGIHELVTCAGIAKKSSRHILEEDLTIIKKAAMIEDQGRLIWVGEENDLNSALKNIRKENQKKSTEPEVIQLRAATVIPGLIDAHTHLVFAGDRIQEFELRNQGVSYQEIAHRGGGIRYTVKQTLEANESELLRLAEARAKVYLKQGVTTVEVKSGYGLSEESEIKILKVINKIKSVRAVATYLGPHAVPKGRTADEYIDEMIQSTLPKIKKLKLAERVDMYVEPGFFDLTHAKKFFSAAKKLGFRFTVHIDQLSYSGGCKMITELGADSLDHLVYTESDDFMMLAKSKATCVLLPTSDFYLKMRYPPARALIAAGARVALATDYNPGTAPSQDVSFVGVLARLEMKMTLPEVIAALTMGGAHALGLHNELGSLEHSKVCDFAVLDCSWRDLFYSVGAHPIKSVFRSGKLVEL